MPSGFTSSKAVAAATTTIVTAVFGLLISAGLHIRPEFRDAVVQFITVATPAALLLWGWLHHNHVKHAVGLATAGVAPPPPVQKKK